MCSSLGRRYWRNALFLLLSITIGYLFITSQYHSTQYPRVHPRALQAEVNIAAYYGAPNNSIIFPRGGGSGGGSGPRPQIVRPASDEEYQKAESKGETLMCWMRDPSLAGSQATTPWTRWSQLSEWGWTGPQNGQPITMIREAERDNMLARIVGRLGRTEQTSGYRGSVEHKKTPAHAPTVENGRTYTYPVSLKPATLTDSANEYRRRPWQSMKAPTIPHKELSLRITTSVNHSQALSMS